LLVRQHYQNFVKRFAGTNIRIDQLSRLVTGKTAKAVKEGITDGHVNIVIGTHALFAKSLKFCNLGLLIVDEEQRFGVKQKERLKEIKEDVNVLTLTATPIPRTLQMSLTGVKQLSIIATPPVDRLATRSFVLPVDQMVIREALMREHYRGGQSFYVVPRIAHLQEIEDMLRDIAPELRCVTAHGQMPPTDLEDRMTAFYDGQYDILLATNIIESGIDIPRANTMIIHHAEMFGLSQLYQIRGRIGRSKLRAYCYLTHPVGKILTPQATKCLDVLETLDSLGAGFQLASHDMDIRGAGNLLGDQQSGHIREVGVELYQQMLEEAVAAARAGIDVDELDQTSDTWVPNINMGAAVLIPETYVEDLSLRMSLYRRLADLLSDDDIENFAAEMIDRFGDLPREVDNLLDTVRLKIMCKHANIDRVDAGPKGVLIGFRNDQPPNVDKLFAWLQKRRGAVKLRPDQKISAVKDWPNLNKRIQGLRPLLKDMLAALA
jgi:transcription-repair coupling factor (superfamily II helicase)